MSEEPATIFGRRRIGCLDELRGDMTCQFIPPYLLQHLATRAADPAIGSCGARTLALDGRLRARRELAPRQSIVGVDGDEARVIHTAANTETLPGTVARSVGDPAVGDAAIDEA